MKRLILTEEQFERIKNRLNESDVNKYSREVTLNFGLIHNTGYKGYEIDSIEPVKLKLFYTIDILQRSWGIDGIDIHSLSGPSKIEVLVKYYKVQGDENLETDMVSVPILFDWSIAQMEEERGKGVVSIDDIVEVGLVNDKDGNLLVHKINLVKFAL